MKLIHPFLQYRDLVRCMTKSTNKPRSRHIETPTEYGCSRLFRQFERQNHMLEQGPLRRRIAKDGVERQRVVGPPS